MQTCATLYCKFDFYKQRCASIAKTRLEILPSRKVKKLSVAVCIVAME